MDPFTVMMRSKLKLLISLIELTVILVSVSCMMRLIVFPLLPMMRPIKLLWAKIFKIISLVLWKTNGKFDVIAKIRKIFNKKTHKRSNQLINLRLVCVNRFLLHNFQDASACVGAVLRITINGDGLLQ